MNFNKVTLKGPLRFTHRSLIFQKNCKFSAKPEEKKEPSSTTPYDDLVQAYSSEEIESRQEQEKLQQYERIKDISRMRLWHRCQINGYATPENQFKWQQERWAQKERYARYGEASGVEPGLMWPNDQELEQMKLEEKEWSPQLFETLKQYNEKVKSEKQACQARLKQIDENFKKYPQMLEEYVEKLRERQKSLDEAKQRRQARIKEIQDYFGYAIDENDPRFQVKLAMREEEDKTVTRLARKKAKQAAMLEKLQAMTASLAAQLPDNPPEKDSGNNDQNPPIDSKNL